MKNLRCFIALPVKLEISRFLRKFVQGDRKLRAVPVQNYHVSILFLGSIDQQTVDAVQRYMNTLPKGVFEIHFQKAGFFPDENSRRIIAATFQQSRGIHRVFLT